MERKRFFELVGASSLGIASGTNLPGFNTRRGDFNSFQTTTSKKKVLMKVGCQSGGLSFLTLSF